MDNTTEIKTGAKLKKRHSVSYDNWGYAFISPFFIIYIIFSLIPLLTTFIYSMFEYYKEGLGVWVGPNFVGLNNFKLLFTAQNSHIGKFLGNTIFMWLIGFIPQIIVSLVLAVWFTNTELNLKGQRFFKTVIYLPNLIMAAAFAMLVYALFSDEGPVNKILMSTVDKLNGVKYVYDSEGYIVDKVVPEGVKAATAVRFFASVGWTRTLIAGMNFLMWYGNTTILLMAGVMGIDNSLFEAARIDGASPGQVFFKITMPLLLPIFVYVFITSLIGGIQMFDVPQIVTNGKGRPNDTTMTLIMDLNMYLKKKDYGTSGAMSVVLFAMTAVLSGFVYKSTMSKYQNKR
ncbi:MAG: sugar ABC transporter permease [Treponema sp.]|nr:sugar ABC transporter permease [Treponema sp.]